MKKKKKAIFPKRLFGFLNVFFLLFLLLIVRIGWLQFVKGSSLKDMAQKQQSTNRTISPKRGTIYDSTGKSIAISAQVDTVTINPSKLIVHNSEEKTKENQEKLANIFSEIFELDYNTTLAKVQSNTSYQAIAKKVEEDKINKLKQWMDDNDFYSGINIDSDTKRYYPYSNLASNLIGFCGDDNQGLSGLEYYWDNVLTGTPRKNFYNTRCFSINYF